MKILIIDNYDSFTYNLYQLVGSLVENDLNNSVIVKRNDMITLEEIKTLNFDKIIISPGPGSPDDPKYFGECRNVILQCKEIPILGVCLGMQGIADCFGGQIIKAKKPMHGKISHINHNGKGIFSDIPQDISVMRYHSLIVNKETLPNCFEVTAQSGDEIMGLRHKARSLEGVQFHPESYATEYGEKMLSNFLFTS